VAFEELDDGLQALIEGHAESSEELLLALELRLDIAAELLRCLRSSIREMILEQVLEQVLEQRSGVGERESVDQRLQLGWLGGEHRPDVVRETDIERPEVTIDEEPVFGLLL
jgi:hypothetical protein